MARRAAIRTEGDGAEQRFLELVPHARVPQQASLGDAIVTVDGEDEYVEIKECHAAPGRSGTINQVRPIKYICCIVWAPERNCWYVLSPDQLVRLAAAKQRGQHTEIPFESMNFNINSLGADLHSTCDDEGLSGAVTAAIRRGRQSAQLRDAMHDLLNELQTLRERYRQRVQQ